MLKSKNKNHLKLLVAFCAILLNISLLQAQTASLKFKFTHPLQHYSKSVQDDYDARDLGMIRYSFTNLPDSLDPLDIEWLDVTARQIPADHNMQNIRKLKIHGLHKNYDFEFLKTMPKLEILELYSPSLEVLPNEISELKNLQLLVLMECQKLSDINAIKNLPRLRILDVEASAISALPKNINSCPKLSHVFIYRSKNLVDFSSLAGNSSLEYLRINQCELKAVPKELGSCTKLWCLDLTYNPLSDLSGIKELTQVRSLILERCLPGRYIPDELKTLKNLRRLVLRYGYYDQIPSYAGLKELTGLKEFETGIDKLTTIPTEITEATSIERLQIGGSRMVRVKGIEKMRNLKYLRLTGRFSQIPPELAQLDSLQTLILGGNEQLKSMEGVQKLTNLDTLNMHRCKITRVPAGFSNLKKLKRLVLSRTPLVDVSNIRDLPELRYLSLSECDRLTTLPASLSSNKALEFVWLQRCYKLTSAPGLGGLPQLKNLNIKSTSISELPANFSENVSLEEISIEYNKNLKDLSQLYALPKLYKIRAMGCNLQSFDYQKSKMPALRILYLSNNNELKSLGNFEDLKNLDVLRIPLNVFTAEQEGELREAVADFASY